VQDQDIICQRCDNVLSTRPHGVLCPKCARMAAANTRNARLKLAIYDHYGRRCVCCGETNIEFLSVDHMIPRDQKKKEHGIMIYSIIAKKGFPEEYRILCMNCNFSYGHVGYCPHRPFLRFGKFGLRRNGDLG